MGKRHIVVEVQPGSVPGESNSANVDLAETEPWENDGSGNDAVEPESGVVLAGVGERLARFAAVVDEENNLSPDQCQGGPPEETVSPLKGIMELGARAVGCAKVSITKRRLKMIQEMMTVVRDICANRQRPSCNLGERKRTGDRSWMYS